MLSIPRSGHQSRVLLLAFVQLHVTKNVMPGSMKQAHDSSSISNTRFIRFSISRKREPRTHGSAPLSPRFLPIERGKIGILYLFAHFMIIESPSYLQVKPQRMQRGRLGRAHENRRESTH